uniref:CHY-type domain-containing protein n=1 Tax=Oryza brachyantha TaxID=4533 RepID=J3N350_ORYBR
MELNSEQHGCAHYTRGCKIRAPCCGEVFDCRHCHNDAKNSLEIDLSDRHEIPRHEIKKVLALCSLLTICFPFLFFSVLLSVCRQTYLNSLRLIENKAATATATCI